MNLLRFSTIAAFASAGCISITPIAYRAQPDRISDPQGEVKALILANTSNGCISEAAFDKQMLLVKFICPRAANQGAVRFEQVADITLDKYSGGYRVKVTHSRGAPDFFMWSRNRDDMERLVDALTALTRSVRPDYAPSQAASKI